MFNSNLRLIQHNVQWLQAVPRKGNYAQPLLFNAGAQAFVKHFMWPEQSDILMI